MIETEVNRALNHAVALYRPRVLSVEKLDFRGSGLSRRMNRLLTNCGRGAVTKKLAGLNERYSIEIHEVEPAYTSKTCSGCGYVESINVAISLGYRGSKGPLHLLIDSTGIKVEGEGEWNAGKHGSPKRRVWRKIHLGIDEETLEIRAVEITGSHIGDAPVLPDLLSQIPEDEEIGSVTADGAYDTRKCHNAIADRDAPTLSLRPARPPSRGKPSPQGRSALSSDQ